MTKQETREIIQSKAIFTEFIAGTALHGHRRGFRPA